MADSREAAVPDFFRSLVQVLPDLVWIKDPNGVYLTCNHRFETLYGAPEADIVGKTDKDFVSPELAAFFRSRDLAAIAARRTVSNEERLTFESDGHVEHLQTLKTPMFDADGQLIGVLGIARDLTEQVRLRELLEHSLAQLQEAEQVAARGSWEHDLRTDRLTWSPEVHRILGIDGDCHLPRLGDLWAHVHPDDLERLQTRYTASTQLGEPFRCDYRMLQPSGELRHVRVEGQVMQDADGARRMTGTLQDITHQVHANERQAMLAAVVDQSEEGVAIVDPATSAFIEFNEAAARLLGYTREEFVGKRVLDIEAAQEPDEIMRHLQDMTGSQSVQIETRHRRKDGEVRDAVVTARGIDFRGSRYIVANWRDVTDAKRAETEIHRLAHYDALTGLPNRRLLTERLARRLQAGNERRPGFLLIVNLDRFHTINDALGRPVGDAVLAEVASRLQQLLSSGDEVLHLGADEFVVLSEPARGRGPAEATGDALRVANTVLQTLQQPLQVAGHSMELRISIGISLLPLGQADTTSEVLRRADTALHRAKRASVHRIAFFDEGMGAAARRQFELEQLLRLAIPDGQLRMYLQAQVDVHGRLAGAEALVRWQHPVQGLISPAEFVPVAEESGIIVQLDRWMLQTSMALMRRMRDAGTPLRIAVNISPRHFHSPEFVSWVLGALAASGALPEDLTLEVTEGLVIENVDEVINKMHELARNGVSFALDDFGTGYSSLAYLKRLPIHELKIDRSFVHDAAQDADSVAMISTILSIAHHMDLEVVAEGIETPAQVALLAGMEPRIRLQGYHFGRPEEVQAWQARWMHRKPGR